MSLTRKLLKDLHLTDEAIETIIAAHAETVEALKSQRDAISAELEAARAANAAATQEVQQAFDAYRTQVEQDQHKAKAMQLIRLAMIQAGCNEKAIDLLITSLDPAALQLENGVLTNQEAVIAELRAKHAAFFAPPVRVAVPTIQPPIPAGSAMTREDLSRMSADEINRNWHAVKGVLAKGAI